MSGSTADALALAFRGQKSIGDVSFWAIREEPTGFPLHTI
jgi:hypothetical protein